MKNRLTRIADNILSSLEGDIKTFVNYEQAPLPEKENVCAIMQNIFVILFPLYFGHSEMSFDSIDMRVGYRIARVYEDLKIQIHRELMHECVRLDSNDCLECYKAADLLALGFLEYVPALRKALELDMKAAFINDPAAYSYDEIIFSYPGFEAICVYRTAHYFYKYGLRLIPRIMTEWAHSKTGVDIHPGASIGESFFIDHGTGVVIGETTQIGSGVTLYQGVTLGALNFPRDKNGNIIKNAKRHPTIGDRVVIYAGATILGGETTIGSDSIIGGNVWLTSSVEPYSKVLQKHADLEISSRTKK